MKLREHIYYLERIGGTTTTHSNRSLNDHLMGTYNILKSWGCREYVCIAGLFHSIYGTKKFKPALVNPENRFDIVKRIGPRAELLTFFFSLITIEVLKNASVKKRRTTLICDSMEIELSNLLYTQLIEISAANFLEQIPHLVNEEGFDYEQYVDGWDWIEGRVSEKINDHIKRSIKGT
ncbi:hypothetical protein HB364_17965 [Pseudoflavitalea sp. X16]|uniref:DUF6817 domain-containing protein n=1 Tax=Paraflavitalea devenefica TaxID=2716334 RepID=UPI0014246CCD|nr:hypothetical protein [Paraflavitalea devenefica]NII26982.1 hypothetical protein [Paraflavitalea devenefica]